MASKNAPAAHQKHLAAIIEGLFEKSLNTTSLALSTTMVRDVSNLGSKKT